LIDAFRNAVIEKNVLMNLRITFLGTGTSVGVPVIGCQCSTCQSNDPRDHRMRSSIFIEAPNGNLLVDTGPDLHFQALRANMTKVDAVLFTHAHMDHITGFDELRAFCWRRNQPLPLYANQGCIKEIQRMFKWAFDPQNTHKGYVQAKPHSLDSDIELANIKITPLPVEHGSVETSGFRFDLPSGQCFAYIPDVKTIPTRTLSSLQNLDLLIIDALREEEHPTHMNIAQAQAISELLGKPQTYFTHISHELDREKTQQSLPSHIQLAYDQLQITLPF